MAVKQFNLKPKKVPKINTKYRTINTEIPNPESVDIINQLRKYEPNSMTGQPPVVWDKAIGINVYDKWGNKWIDFSSCVVVANVGHCNPKIQQAIISMTEHGLLNNYCFPSEIRAKLTKKIIEDIAPEELDKVFLLSTGSETTECAIKLARTNGIKVMMRFMVGLWEHNWQEDQKEENLGLYIWIKELYRFRFQIHSNMNGLIKTMKITVMISVLKYF